MLLITHADRQNATIWFSAKPAIISSKTNVCPKKKGLSINHINMTHSDKRNLSTSCSFKQILAQQHTCLQLQLLHIIAPCHTILKPFPPPQTQHNQCNLKLL